MVSFYDIMEETYEYSYIPMAVGIWAPKGNFDEALVYHKYKDSNYSIVLKRNKQFTLLLMKNSNPILNT